MSQCINASINQSNKQGKVSRVMSSEISGGKFPEIYSNLSGNLLNNFSLYTL